MTSTKRRQPTIPQSFDPRRFLESAGAARRMVRYEPSERVFCQGDEAASVMYIQQGGVRLSVLSATGKEVVVGMLRRGDFFGEGCLGDQPLRMATATALTVTRVLIVGKKKMIEMLRKQSPLSDQFITHVLGRTIRIKEDLVDQLFNYSEKRLARTLLLLAQCEKEDKRERVVPELSRSVLAEMVGTTRSRVSFIMNKFRKLGFIESNGGLTINGPLLRVVLHD